MQWVAAAISFAGGGGAARGALASQQLGKHALQPRGVAGVVGGLPVHVGRAGGVISERPLEDGLCLRPPSVLSAHLRCVLVLVSGQGSGQGTGRTFAGTTHSCAASAMASAPADLRTTVPHEGHASQWSIWGKIWFRSFNFQEHSYLSSSLFGAAWDEARMGHSASWLRAFTSPGEAHCSRSSSGNAALSSLLWPALTTVIDPGSCCNAHAHDGAVSAGAAPNPTPRSRAKLPTYDGAPGSTPRGQQPRILWGPRRAEQSPRASPCHGITGGWAPGMHACSSTLFVGGCVPVELQPDASERLILLWCLEAGVGKTFHQLSDARCVCGELLECEGLRCGAEAA